MANGLSPRDIDLIFKANTRGAAQDINTLGTSIDNLKSKIATQTAEANKGVDTTDALKASYKELTSALADVKDNYALLAKVQTAQDKVAAQTEKVAAATAKYEELATALAAVEKPSQRMQAGVDRAAKAVESAKAKLDQMQQAAAKLGAAFDAVGGNSENLGESQAKLVTQTKEIASAVNEVEAALDGYAGKAKAAASAAEALSDSQRFNELAGSPRASVLPAAQLEYLRNTQASYKELEAAIVEAERAQQAFNSAVSSRALINASDTLRQVVSEENAAAAAAERLAQSRAFAQLASDSIEAANNQVRFKASLDGSAVSATSLRAAITAIIDPTRDALTTIDGIAAQIDKAQETLNSPKALRTSQYQTALNDSTQAGAAAGRLAGQIDDYTQQQAALDASTAAFKRQQAATLDAAEAIQRNSSATKEDIDQLQREEAALEKAGAAMKADEERLIQLGAALAKAGVNTKELEAETQRLTATAQKGSQTIAALNDKTGHSGDGGFLGLKPYELQNLSYQVNDVVTGLASGQRPFQVLAQQGGQIAQIFPGFTTALIANAGAIAGVAAAAGLAYLAIHHLSEETQAAKTGLEIFNGAAVKAADINPTNLAAASVAMQQLGATSAEAKTSLIDLVNKGFDSASIQGFIGLAGQLATETGVKLPEALTTLQDGFNGTYEGVARLDDKFNFLTAAQREQIQSMYAHGDSAKATQAAMDAFAEQTDKARTPVSELSQVTRNLGEDLNALVHRIFAVQDIESSFGNFFHNVGVGANYLLLRLRGVNSELAAIAAKQGRDVGPDGKLTTGTAPNVAADPNANVTSKEGQDYLRDLKLQQQAGTDIADVTKRGAQLAAIRAREIERASAAGVRGADLERAADIEVENEKAKYAKNDAERAKQAESRREAAQRKAEAAARAAAELRKRIGDADASQAKALAELTAQASGGSADLATQLSAAVAEAQAQVDQLINKAEDYRKLTGGKGTIGGQSIDDYEAAIRAQGAILANDKQLTVYENALNELVKARSAELDNIQKKLTAHQITPEASVDQSREVTSRYAPQIQAIVDAGTKFAASIKGAVPSPQLQAFAAKLDAATPNDVADNKTATKNALAADQDSLNDKLTERNDLVKTYTDLQQQGVITQGRADELTAAAFEQTKAGILDSVSAMQTLIDKLKEMHAITPEAYAALSNSLKLTTAQTDHLSDRQKNLKNAVNQAITKDAVSTIEKTASALADVALHGGSVTKVFEAIGEGLLEMLADVLKTIAELILEAVILDAVDKATGGFLKPILQIMGKTASVLHGGTDSVGSGGSGLSRTNMQFSPADIAAMPRYHTGAAQVGLSADESVAVLKKGEAVLTEDNPDHPANKAKQSGGATPTQTPSVRNVLVLGDDQVAAAMSGSDGEQTVMTHIKRNAPTIKQLLR